MNVARRHSTLLIVAALGALLTGSTGCKRAYYRQQANDEVYNLLDHVASDPRWPLDRISIEVDERSRFYDPSNPDHPPMPPDDPTAHKLMHCVYCMEGYPCWHQNGDTPTVQNEKWKSYLPIEPDGELVLDRDAAVMLARVQSRDFQSQLETLYLSALDVTFERFRFDAQFFGDNATFFFHEGELRAPGPGSRSVLGTDTGFQVRKLYASGGELLVGFANSFVWQFAGTDVHTTNSLLNFNLVQPLLRAGGRARVLERLTRSERTLLANVRAMERYRHGFYLEVVAGGNPGPGPGRLGGFLGGAGLEGFTGVGGGGFGRIGGVAGGGGGGGAGAGQAGGYIGLLQNQLIIRNQEANVAGLRDSLAQLEATYDAGRIDRFQVDLARQALYNTQSVLLGRKAAYQGTLDNYKVSLGLPPDLPVRIEDPLLHPFQLIDPRLVGVQNEVARLLDELRNRQPEPGLNRLDDLRSEVEETRRQAAAQIAIVERDFERLEENLPARREALRRLREHPELSGEQDVAYSVEALNRRVAELERDFAEFLRRFEVTSIELEQAAAEAITTVPELITLMTELSAQLTELSLVQARVRIDAATLVPVRLASEEALEIARENRVDWMNARASVVDTWRLIEFNANALESTLNLTFSGDLGTVGRNPLNFDNRTGRLFVGAEFDAPITRQAERNQYRQALIEYQQARRGYMAFVDRIHQGLRATLRTLELNQLNFELRRAAVLVAINQVNLTRLRLTEPPRPGEEFVFGATTARDLVDSLDRLLSVQNEFLSVWVDYEVQRLGLDFDLGTMRLDHRGIWIDPGEIIGSDPNVTSLIDPEPRPYDYDADIGPSPRGIFSPVEELPVPLTVDDEQDDWFSTGQNVVRQPHGDEYDPFADPVPSVAHATYTQAGQASPARASVRASVQDDGEKVGAWTRAKR